MVGARRSARRCAPPGSLIDVAGTRLHIVCAGAGAPPVVFESGIAASSVSWTTVLPAIAEYTRVCAYDRAGLAWSSAASDRRTVGRQTHELESLLVLAGVESPYVLVGHSFGAFLVCAFANVFPGKAAGLVLLDPPSEWRRITREQERLLWGGIQLSRIGGVLARVGVVRACLAMLRSGAAGVPRNFVKVFGPTAVRTLEHIVGEVRKLPPEMYPIVQAHWCDPKCFRAMAQHLAALQETAAFVARLTSLPNIPVVVVSSDGHETDVIAEHQRLAQLSPQGRHVVAAGSGHWIQFDDPDLVVATVREVVDSVRGGGSTR
jgi:pimeloyl-ACP methyl ester carboxylesterase